jgi:hypothetical protein
LDVCFSLCVCIRNDMKDCKFLGGEIYDQELTLNIFGCRDQRLWTIVGATYFWLSMATVVAHRTVINS